MSVQSVQAVNRLRQRAYPRPAPPLAPPLLNAGDRLSRAEFERRYQAHPEIKEVFPGLWLQAAALWDGDLAAMLAVLHEGLASPEHATFRARLRAPPGERPESQ
jgi:hypothetical protein